MEPYRDCSTLMSAFFHPQQNTQKLPPSSHVKLSRQNHCSRHHSLARSEHSLTFRPRCARILPKLKPNRTEPNQNVPFSTSRFPAADSASVVSRGNDVNITLCAIVSGMSAAALPAGVLGSGGSTSGSAMDAGVGSVGGAAGVAGAGGGGGGGEEDMAATAAFDSQGNVRIGAVR
jgi:hypothetical protein